MEHMVDARGWMPLVLCGFIALLAARCFVESWLQRRRGKTSWRRHAIIGAILASLSPLVYSPTFAAMPAFMAIAIVLLGLETKKNRLRPVVDGIAMSCLIGGVGLLAFGYTISLGYGPSMWPASPKGFSLSLLEPNAYRTSLPARGDKVQVWIPKTFNGPNFDPDKDWPGGRYHKRIFGMPGDHVSIDMNGMTVNGKRVADCTKHGAPVELSRWLCRVSLPSDRGPVVYDVSWGGEGWFWGGTDLVVPKGKVFLLGDNLTESADSRDRGVVPIEWVVGRHL